MDTKPNSIVSQCPILCISARSYVGRKALSSIHAMIVSYNRRTCCINNAWRQKRRRITHTENERFGDKEAIVTTTASLLVATKMENKKLTSSLPSSAGDSVAGGGIVAERENASSLLNDIHEKIKDICLLNCLTHVLLLQCSSFV